MRCGIDTAFGHAPPRGRLDAMLKSLTLAAVTALSVFLCSPSAFAGPERGEDRPNRLQQPPNAGRPLEVLVGIHITNVAQIDEVLERFQIRGTLFARWRDDRLAGKLGQAIDPVRVFKPGEIWQPELEMVNAVTPRESHDITMTVDPGGSVDYAEGFSANLSTPFSLERFPFDSQSLLTVIRPLRSAYQNLVLVADSGRSEIGQEPWVSLVQWRLGDLTASTRSATTIKGYAPLPEIDFNLRVRRKYFFYIWKVFLPLLVMVIISWSTFWVQITDQYSQITIALTTILTVIAFAFSISQTLPKVPYLTLIDAFFLTSYLFVFLAILELIMIHNLLVAQRERTAKRIRYRSRWLFPAAYFIANALLFSAFLL
jgi:neurotransmitter-gated ion-channel